MDFDSSTDLRVEGETGADEIELRPLRTEAEFAACVRMQQDVWGDTYGELVPPIILQITQRVGGVAIGAFTEDDELQGIVFGITGIRDGRLTHWSHILAVDPARRNSGLGRRLKEYQREVLRPLGVESICWTFDPLVAKNAHLNLNGLGAEVTEYIVEMYGNTGSMLHRLGTDRLLVDWKVNEEERASTAMTRAIDMEAPVANLTEMGEPIPLDRTLSPAPEVRIAIPADIEAAMAEDIEFTKRWQRTVRRAFLHYLGTGYRVSAFESAGEGEARCYYYLTDPSR